MWPGKTSPDCPCTSVRLQKLSSLSTARPGQANPRACLYSLIIQARPGHSSTSLERLAGTNENRTTGESAREETMTPPTPTQNGEKMGAGGRALQLPAWRNVLRRVRTTHECPRTPTHVARPRRKGGFALRAAYPFSASFANLLPSLASWY